MKAPVSGSPTYYFYNQAGQLLYQWEPGKAVTTDFVYLGRKLVARDESIKLIAPASVSFDSNPNDGTYIVSWSAVTGATSYTVQESANGGTWGTVYTGSAISLSLSGRDGGDYRYQVRACDESACTAWAVSPTLGVRPTLPVITVPSGTVNGTYTVSWSSPASTLTYDVQEQVDGGAWNTIAADTAATFVNRPGNATGSYAYRVSAKNAYGTRGWGTSSTVNVDTSYGVVPAAPANLTVPTTSADGSATLTWSTSDLATRYVLQQSRDGGTSWSELYDGGATSTGVAGLPDGSYGYQVLACNSYGCSNWTSGDATLVVLHPPTTAPTLSVPASSSTGTYTVAWTGVPGQVSYTLQEAVDGDAWSTVQTAGNTDWTSSNHSNGTYGYQVHACNSSGCGPWSITAETVVTHPPTGAPVVSAPSSSNTGSFTVTWTAVSTAASYTLQEQLNGGTWATIQSGSTTSRAISGKGDGSYGYRAQACNVGGCGVWSTVATTVVTHPPATAPTLTVPTSSTTGSYTVSWTAVATATSYNLQEQVNSGSWSTIQASGATSRAISGKGTATYGYRVQACNAGGCGTWSATKSINVTRIPATPTGLRGTIWVFSGAALAMNSASINRVGVSLATQEVQPASTPDTYELDAFWSASTGATSYNLQYCKTGVCLTKSTSATSILSIPVNGTNYTINVQACNAAGCSAWSTAATPTVSNG